MRAGSPNIGPTAEIYRHPRDITTARVFSDPPINTAPITKQGGEILIGDSIRLPAGRFGAAIPDGSYDWGIRPHHITADGAPRPPRRIEGRVLVTELRGSESIVHFDLNGRTWVSQSHGIHPFEVGEHRAAPCRRRRELLLRRRRPAHRGRQPMARITLQDLRHTYGTMAAWRGRLGAEADDARTGRRRRLCAAWTVRLRQDHASQSHLRPAAADRGAHPVRRRRCDRQEPGGAQHRAGVPVPGHLRHHDRLRQSRLPAAQPRRSPRPRSTGACTRSPRCSSSSRRSTGAPRA